MPKWIGWIRYRCRVRCAIKSGLQQVGIRGERGVAHPFRFRARECSAGGRAVRCQLRPQALAERATTTPGVVFRALGGAAQGRWRIDLNKGRHQFHIKANGIAGIFGNLIR